jgi:CDP-diacylglycerol---glycerol-3-phosphate 3-phosphatidyltransferase
VRIALVPFIVWLILVQRRWASDAAAALFVVGAASDGLDGYLARKYDLTTRTGQWLDPLADKVLVAAPVLTLLALGRFPAWAAAIIIARELAIVVVRIVLGTRGRSMPATMPAKLKTLLQLFAITLYILPLGASWDDTKLWTLVAALLLTVVTGVQYMIQAVGWLRRQDTAAAPRTSVGDG